MSRPNKGHSRPSCNNASQICRPNAARTFRRWYRETSTPCCPRTRPCSAACINRMPRKGFNSSWRNSRKRSIGPNLTLSRCRRYYPPALPTPPTQTRRRSIRSMASRATCCKCHMQKPISTDYFLDLKLSLCPSMDSQRPFRTLRESLRHYTRKEQIDEVECTHCTFLQLLLAVDNALHALAAAPYADSRSFPTTTRSSEDPSDDDDRDARLFNFRRLRDMLSHRVETNSGNPVCDVDLDDPHCWTPDQLSIWNANTTFFQQLGIWDTDKRIPDLPRAHATFFRHVILARPPKVLTFHINRNVYVHDTIVKLDVHLAFDESLRLAHPFVRHCEAISYALVAVVVHHGNERGGHYTCYRRVTSARHWVHISDEHVVDVAFADVLRAKAYMLFYEITSP
ncbi:hypothetical protein, variant [Aphanomyces invadans]|uniref:ubiquitinyl hydrolase 1 n=1 Tax=Aphanomyces invadans TaxID=157072 RepID=A0A024TP42_9STRA|nr:hypothetical protein, variant [Aphanomyces invadans]ETV95381.1 hypothetical protein, variant [Aphanomyces invadans]|eukprot:XP_008876082.1 hypothetical protein, variant [Aphanomyces invadans]